MSTLPILVMPMHDPGGILFPHLQKITPQLKELFAYAIVSIPQGTQERQSQYLPWLQASEGMQGEPFFHTLYRQVHLPVGDDFRDLYVQAASCCPADQLLHLAFPDRLAYALQSEHHDAFCADMRALRVEHAPRLYQRSAAAWRTHPRNYRLLEGMLTTTGEILFGRALDFAWCHLAVQAGELRDILPGVRNHDMSVLAEMVLLLRERIQTQEVDWLAWEDPLILGCDPRQLRRERERSRDEARKRLSYVVPMMQVLYRESG